MGSYFFERISTNNTVIVFDNRGIGNTTVGYKNFSIAQFAADSTGLLDACWFLVNSNNKEANLF